MSEHCWDMPARMRAVQSPIIPIVAEWIRQHPGTISLGQGVVYHGPPPQVLKTMRQFWEEPDNHKYRPVQGIAPFVEKATEKLRLENGITLAPDSELLVSAGGNMAFMNAVLAVADPQDEIILQVPYYFNHEMAVVIAGCRPVLVGTDAMYQLDVASIQRAVTPRTRAVVTVSPNNPTGAVYPESALRAVNQMCKERGLYHIHDEVYEYFTYDDAVHFSPGSMDGAGRHTISIYSLSKAYGFASWRIGYMVIPRHLMTSVKKIQDTMLVCPPVISQYAGLGALEAGRVWCLRQRRVLEGVRQRFVEGLREVGNWCEVPPAPGAFYFLLRLRREMDPVVLAERLVREHGVAVIPGTAFGVAEGCSLRVSYGALNPDRAEAGLKRLVSGLRAILG